nr:MAG TPA: hypothetical protein [Caudoviricetes sp.]DAU15860.1 MAG TPA: hypothetical protein [Caudoviricetes sp.]
MRGLCVLYGLGTMQRRFHLHLYERSIPQGV